jgi:methyl-CpG-binding domain protein 4
MIKTGWIPPRSPFGLIQEDMWPNEWMILVCCMMLNCTTRKQAEKVIPAFQSKFPIPESLLQADRSQIVTLISPLGFGNKRTDNVILMTKDFLKASWNHAKDLHGIGQYASTAWEIFCRGTICENEPQDGALKVYWKWYKKNYENQESGNCQKIFQIKNRLTKAA